MNRNLWSLSALVGFSACVVTVLATDVPAPVKEAGQPAKVEKSSGTVSPEQKANEQRLLAIQKEITELKRQDAQLRDAIRKQFISIESAQTNIISQDKEFILLNEQLKQASAQVAELRAKIKQKMDSMPEFKDASDKMTAIKGQMQENSRKLTELLKEKSKLNSEIFAAMQKDHPPVKANEIPPVQKPSTVALPPAAGK